MMYSSQSTERRFNGALARPQSRNARAATASAGSRVDQALSSLPSGRLRFTDVKIGKIEAGPPHSCTGVHAPRLLALRPRFGRASSVALQARTEALMATCWHGPADIGSLR